MQQVLSLLGSFRLLRWLRCFSDFLLSHEPSNSPEGHIFLKWTVFLAAGVPFSLSILLHLLKRLLTGFGLKHNYADFLRFLAPYVCNRNFVVFELPWSMFCFIVRLIISRLGRTDGSRPSTSCTFGWSCRCCTSAVLGRAVFTACSRCSAIAITISAAMT